MDRTAKRFLFYYVKSLLKLKYRHTYLGFLWNFLEPAFYLLILSIIFSVVNRMDISNYAVYLFGALIPWRYFESTVLSATDSIVGGDWLLRKMHVSPLIFPVTRWMIASTEFFFSFAVVLLLFMFIKKTWTIHLLILPLSFIPWAMLGLGLGLICAVLFVFFRDIRPIVQMILIFAFFTSPILFKADLFRLHSLQATLVSLHPITYFARLFQKPIYYQTWPDLNDWAVSLTVSFSCLAVGYYFFNKVKERFYFYI